MTDSLPNTVSHPPLQTHNLEIMYTCSSYLCSFYALHRNIEEGEKRRGRDGVEVEGKEGRATMLYIA
jgi:hypothetical protein